MAKLTLKALFGRIFRLAYFQGEDPAIPYVRVDTKSRLVVVTGDNAGGKSFFRRLVRLVAKEKSVECIHLSMEARAGNSMMYGPARAMVYGDEAWQSTGTISTSTILTGIRTCEGRTSDHVIFWDEPDLGLSDAWAAGAGQKLAAFAQRAGEHTRGILIVTHRKALVQELLPANPGYIHLGAPPGEAPPTLKAWLDAPVVPKDPDLLGQLSHARFKKIQAILDRNK